MQKHILLEHEKIQGSSNTQNVSSPMYNGRIGGCEWVDCILSLLIEWVDLKTTMNTGETQSLMAIRINLQLSCFIV